MTTEAEAKNMWCPHVRFVIGPQSSTWQEAAFSNRARMDGSVTCQGSGCMAWRWRVTAVDDKDNDIHDHGYCGLAGKP